MQDEDVCNFHNQSQKYIYTSYLHSHDVSRRFSLKIWNLDQYNNDTIHIWQWKEQLWKKELLLAKQGNISGPGRIISWNQTYWKDNDKMIMRYRRKQPNYNEIYNNTKLSNKIVCSCGKKVITSCLYSVSIQQTNYSVSYISKTNEKN